MQSALLSHDLNKEFPDLVERLHELKLSNNHFSKIFDEYHELDTRIVKVEEGLDVLDDFSLEELKKKRLILKDEIYKMLTAEA